MKTKHSIFMTKLYKKELGMKKRILILFLFTGCYLNAVSLEDALNDLNRSLGDLTAALTGASAPVVTPPPPPPPGGPGAPPPPPPYAPKPKQWRTQQPAGPTAPGKPKPAPARPAAPGMAMQDVRSQSRESLINAKKDFELGNPMPEAKVKTIISKYNLYKRAVENAGDKVEPEIENFITQLKTVQPSPVSQSVDRQPTEKEKWDKIAQESPEQLDVIMKVLNGKIFKLTLQEKGMQEEQKKRKLQEDITQARFDLSYLEDLRRKSQPQENGGDEDWDE